LDCVTIKSEQGYHDKTDLVTKEARL